ncbi:hypothetical protein BWQ96_01211 [Gracilariopsis chorda]|uniref:Uncharacterized protein n=1 Tax=Gracilariopsis chorda TaxID=448386 RepID=A0A2V3J438_9FLOR|nr:hypothetical protein BWQ96_01211 [Gracilariopsis chorda]|eukprot:PXF49073.1 hypothetical protein BWQ96_01211 [Gracilariopsis chorda]
MSEQQQKQHQQQEHTVEPTPTSTKSPFLLSATAVLLNSITLAALLANRLGTAPLSYQITLTLLVSAWLPYIHSTNLHTRLLSTSIPLKLVTAVWLISSVLPTINASVVELFTGHRRKEANLFSAIWRVYAILALWVAIGVLNERLIRPWWQSTSPRLLGGWRAHSVSSRAHNLAVNQRASALDHIMEQMVAISKRKLLAQRAIQTKTEQLQKTKSSLDNSKQMLTSAQQKAKDAHNDDNQLLVMSLTQMVDNTQVQCQVLEQDIQRLKVDVHTSQTQLQPLQQRWEQSLNIENHTRFYR